MSYAGGNRQKTPGKKRPAISAQNLGVCWSEKRPDLWAEIAGRFYGLFAETDCTAQTTQKYSMYVRMVITYSKTMDQPGKVANPARGQLNRENEYFSVPVRA